MQSLIQETPEELAKMLMDSSKEQMYSLYEKNDDLSLTVRDFILAHAKVNQKDVRDYSSLMQTARENEAFFVTPNDLYKHMSNLKKFRWFCFVSDPAPLKE
jgi:hypothetical protein